MCTAYSIPKHTNTIYKTIFIYFSQNSRTPGSRQPSPAEESLNRSATLFDPATQHSFHQHHMQHMLSAGMDHHNNQLNSHSYHPQMINHQMQGPVMNGVGGMQVAQVKYVRFKTNYKNRRTKCTQLCMEIC